MSTHPLAGHPAPPDVLVDANRRLLDDPGIIRIMFPKAPHS